MKPLAILTKVNLREAWKHEAIDFTTWLAQEENLALLSDEVGIDISHIETEAPVGRFSVDILCEEQNTGKKIIIENQLEMTDHDHLGKLITYGSGQDAEFIIWIVKGVREEHRQAIDWLNEHTTDKLNFFLVQIELWQIGESPYAPKFQVICRPNEWGKAIRTASKGDRSELQLLQHNFWGQFKEFAQKAGTKLRLRKTYPQHWYDISIGNSSCHVCLTMNSQSATLGCEIYIPNSVELYEKFESRKSDIEGDLGEQLEWMTLNGKKACRIKLSTPGDVRSEKDWDKHCDWLLKQAEIFQSVFKKYS